MKIWLVPFRELDDKRLNGQHVELHAIYTNVLKRGTKWKGWENYYTAFAFLHEAVLIEQGARGREVSNHKTPGPGFDYHTFEPYPINPEELRADRWMLVCRWGGEYKGRGDQPSEYDELIRLYHAQGGCLHEPYIDGGAGVCRLCKNFQLTEGVWVPRTGRRSDWSSSSTQPGPLAPQQPEGQLW